MRTSVTLDDGLVKTAMELSGCKTKREVLEEGLKLLVQVRRQERIRDFRGKLPWTGDMKKMRTDK